jgi:hypothetical protein
MNRTLSQWVFGVVDDTAQAALMLAVAGAALSLLEQDRRSESQHSPRSDRCPGDGYIVVRESGLASWLDLAHERRSRGSRSAKRGTHGEGND